MLLFYICVSFGPFITNEGKIYTPTNHINSKNIKSLKSGWHHIQTLDDSIISQYPEIFSSQSMSSSNWFTSYLNIDQAQQLASTNKTILYPLHKSFKQNSKTRGLNKFLVRASPSFFEQVDNSFFTEIKSVSTDLYSLTTSRSNRNKALQLFTDSPEVLSFSELPKIKPLNRWAKGFVQSGGDTFAFDGHTYTGNSSLNLLGYFGEGQVATIEDSGVDFTLRYFKDNSISVPINSINLNHRKIVKYKTLETSDSTDYSGHGTHCAGSICGENIDSDDYFNAYNGGAPKAKLYVVDLEDGHGDMTIDSDFSSTIADMNKLGSFISSNSWGLENEHLQVKYMYDVASYQYPNILWVFAAGNSYGCGTVMLPASCKNLLTVGALNQVPNHDMERSENAVFDLIADDGTKLINPTKFFVTNTYNSLMSKSDTINAYNKTAVYYESGDSSYSDSAVFVTSCEQVLDAESRGCTFFLARTSLTCSNTENSIGVVIENSINFNSSFLGKRISIFPRKSSTTKTMNVASFSSRGPSAYGSIKPEVVAPGTDILSASRGHNNEVIEMSGTSMACPTTAGEMIILREYVVKKFGITNPTSNLLKALVVCGAVKPKNPSTPDNEWGFGMLNVGNLVEEISGNKVLIQNEISITLGSTLSFDLVVDDVNRPISIAMAYIDPQTSPESVISLIIDLDLFVITPSQKLLHPIGNSEDQFSTVERIYIENKKVEKGTYHVYVKSSQPRASISKNSIPLSIVAIGNISSFTPTASNSKLLENATDNSPWTDVCTTPSVATQDGCTCNEGKTGLFCQHEVINLPTEYDQVYTIPPMETIYLKGTLNGMNENFNLNMYQQTTPFCYIGVHTNPVNLPNKIMNYMYSNTFNHTMMSLTGYPANNFQSNRPVYFALTNFGTFNAVITTSLTIDKDPQYGKVTDREPNGFSFGSIVAVVIVIIFAIVIIVCIVICCMMNKSKRKKNNRRNNNTGHSTSANANNNNTTSGGAAAHMTVPTEVDSNYVPPSYPSNYQNTYPYPYPTAGYPSQNTNGMQNMNTPGAAPAPVYQPSNATTVMADEVPTVEPQPVSNNQGIPPVNPYDPANFPSVNANNNANRPSYYPPYANPDDDK